MTTFTLPAPECRLGFTRAQLVEILGPRMDEFTGWMRGQTMALCDGQTYNRDTKKYEESCGGQAHGGIVYSHDLAGFLRGREVWD